MVGDPFGRLTRDMQAAARDLDDLGRPTGDYSQELAAAVVEEAPFVTGFLRSTVYADSSGVGVSAVYAGVVHDRNPYAERAMGRADPGDVFQAYVDDVLDAHLSTLYV